MKIQIFVALYVILTPLTGFSQNRFYILEVQVKNEQTGIFVPKPVVYIPRINKEIEANKSGTFHVALPAGHYDFCFFHNEFKDTTVMVSVEKDTNIIIYLTPRIRSYLIDDVTISANRLNKVKDIQPGLERIESVIVEKIPSIGGERDVVKALQYLPGVKAGAEGSSEIMVRGGTPDQNMYLLDNALLYNSEHLLGFLSSFNPLSVSKVDLYKGGFPSVYGGRLSAIVDVHSKAPNYNTFSGDINVGTISSKAGIHVPVIKNKSSLFVSGRRTYFDLLIYPFRDKNNFTSLNFHDVFIKYSHKLSDHDFTISYYTDKDKFFEVTQPRNKEFKDRLDLIKKNRIAALTWKSRIGDSKNNLCLNYVSYGVHIENKNDRPQPENEFLHIFRSQIHDFSLKDKFMVPLSKRLKLTAGTEYIHHTFSPSSFYWSDYYLDTTVNKLDDSTIDEIDFYSEMEYSGSKGSDFRIGLRNSNYIYKNGNTSLFEPRLVYKQALNRNMSLKMAYSLMSQPVHLLSNPGLGFPLDIWVPSNNAFEPETSHQFTLGWFMNTEILNQKFSLSLETYYKNMQNIITYKDGYSSHNFSSLSETPVSALSDAVTKGFGKSYGAEFMIDKKSGDFTGWLGYTLSWTMHRFNGINDGEFFFPRYDSRHNISIVGSYKFSKKWAVNFSWSFHTGQAVTLPISSYYLFDFDYTRGTIGTYPNEFLLYEQSKRNAYRMKPYHSLNIDFRRTIHFKRCTGFLEFGFYNVYNRKNPYYYYFDLEYKGWDQENNNLYHANIKSVSVFPVIPFVSFTIKF